MSRASVSPSFRPTGDHAVEEIEAVLGRGQLDADAGMVVVKATHQCRQRVSGQGGQTGQ